MKFIHDFKKLLHDLAFSCTKILPDILYLKLLCLYSHRRINLKNPKTFDEKLWWLKLNNRDPLLTICSDKLNVREYVRKCGYPEILVNQYGVFNDPDQIPFDNYAQEVIIKSTSGSGKNVFFQKGRDDANIPSIKKMFKKALNQNPYYLSREWNYKNIESKIIVEEVLRDSKGKCPLDYKFMCFDGEPKLLFLDVGLINDDNSYNHHYPRNIYDMEFNLLPVWETRPNADYTISKPLNFDRMVEIARKLSAPFPHCRVDLYNVEGNIYFGEITFYHGGGFNDIQPIEWSYKMGSWIDLNSKKVIRK